MARFAQHTKVLARPGKVDELVAKFLEVGAIQADNPACELSLVSTSPDEPDAVYLTEFWTDRESHTRATQSDVVARWAAGMPDLVERGVDSTQLVPEGGKGLS